MLLKIGILFNDEAELALLVGQLNIPTSVSIPYPEMNFYNWVYACYFVYFANRDSSSNV